MRISLIGPFPPFRGGISDFNISLFSELDKSHDIQVINYSTQYPKILFPGETQYKNNVDKSVKSDRILSSINPLTWSKTANKIIGFRPDFVIIHYWIPFFAPALRKISLLLKKNIDTKIIAICHNLIPHENHNSNQLLTKTFLKTIDQYIVMSESVKSDLLEIIPNAKIKLTPHPIYNIFGNTVDKETARTNLDINANNVILYFGLIREYKGLDILLNSLPQIKQNLNDFIVIVAGECYENKEKYYGIIEKLKIQDSVDLRLEFIPDNKVAEYFSAADLVALPYRAATQSGITQIAFNFNRPVVVSAVGGLAEIVPNGTVGYVVKPRSEDFANAIIKFSKKINLMNFQIIFRSIKDYFHGKYL